MEDDNDDSQLDENNDGSPLDENEVVVSKAAETHINLLLSILRIPNDEKIIQELTKLQLELNEVVEKLENEVGSVVSGNKVDINDLPPEIRACLKVDNILINGGDSLLSSSSSNSDSEEDNNNSNRSKDRLQSLLRIQGYGVRDMADDTSRSRKRPLREEEDQDNIIDVTGEEVRSLFEENWSEIQQQNDMTILYHPRAIYEKYADKYKKLKETNRLHLLTKRDRKPHNNKSSSMKPYQPVTTPAPFQILLVPPP